MKRISSHDYQKDMGTLIDLSSPEGYASFHLMGSINIPYQKFMLYYDQYLNKNEPYFLTCKKGIHSNQAVRILEYLGYNVTQVVME
ncbi:MAG: rhodanese-like domain-containing protein [Bacilli bacterium]|nr:rhodanese-like domain-containing protein [Bacilli bacterium]MBR1749018.1 rhodanese-like domain-containing protein [Bacilli bacterium]MBR1817366.1 rhodanese-like domain-containing protein [Bacilli bacterium]